MPLRQEISFSLPPTLQRFLEGTIVKHEKLVGKTFRTGKENFLHITCHYLMEFTATRYGYQLSEGLKSAIHRGLEALENI